MHKKFFKNFTTPLTTLVKLSLEKIFHTMFFSKKMWITFLFLKNYYFLKSFFRAFLFLHFTYARLKSMPLRILFSYKKASIPKFKILRREKIHEEFS